MRSVLHEKNHGVARADLGFAVGTDCERPGSFVKPTAATAAGRATR